MILRFRMSGRTFAYDGEAPVSALEMFALDEIGIDPDEALGVLRAAGAGEAVDGMRALRAFSVLAYLAALRQGSTETWREFAASMHPETFEVLPEPAPVAEHVTHAAAAAAAPAPATTGPDLDVLAEGVLARLEARKTTA